MFMEMPTEELLKLIKTIGDGAKFARMKEELINMQATI